MLLTMGNVNFAYDQMTAEKDVYGNAWVRFQIRPKYNKKI